MHETGHSGLVHWDDPQGWDGEGGGRGSGWGTRVHPWLIHVNVWQKPPQCCKVISFQLKFKKKNILCNTILYSNRAPVNPCRGWLKVGVCEISSFLILVKRNIDFGMEFKS